MNKKKKIRRLYVETAEPVRAVRARTRSRSFDWPAFSGEPGTTAINQGLYQGGHGFLTRLFRARQPSHTHTHTTHERCRRGNERYARP